jgi:hypothetical protein
MYQSTNRKLRNKTPGFDSQNRDFFARQNSDVHFGFTNSYVTYIPEVKKSRDVTLITIITYYEMLEYLRIGLILSGHVFTNMETKAQ